MTITNDDVDIFTHLDMNNNTITNVGNSGGDWTANSLAIGSGNSVLSSGGTLSIRTASSQRLTMNNGGNDYFSGSRSSIIIRTNASSSQGGLQLLTNGVTFFPIFTNRDLVLETQFSNDFISLRPGGTARLTVTGTGVDFHNSVISNANIDGLIDERFHSSTEPPTDADWSESDYWFQYV